MSPTYSHSHAEENWWHAAKPGLNAWDGVHGPPDSVPKGRARKEGGEDEASTESYMHPIVVTTLQATLDAVHVSARECSKGYQEYGQQAQTTDLTTQ